MDAIRLREVSHSYQKTTALVRVSLNLPVGCTVGLIGPDGVGKSTLLSLIAGVKILQEGEVEVFGLRQGIKSEREKLLPRIAFMPQGLWQKFIPYSIRL